MLYKTCLNIVPTIYPMTHESSLENDVAYLLEEQCDWSLDQFDDNDI